MCERERQVESYVLSVLLPLQVLLSEIRTAMDERIMSAPIGSR